MYNLQKLVLGNFLYFAEEGKMIDDITVGIDSFPDVEPPENWNDLGCIMEFMPTREQENDVDYCASPSGGYDKIDDKRTLQDILKFQTRDHSEPFWRMLLGVQSEIVNGTAQTPFDRNRRWIQGWLKVQSRAEDGVDRVVMNVYGRLDIDADPKWSKDVTRPALNFQILYSPIATLLPANIA